MNRNIEQAHFLWALQAICTLHRKAFSPDLARQQVPGPYSSAVFRDAAKAYGLGVEPDRVLQASDQQVRQTVRFVEKVLRPD